MSRTDFKDVRGAHKTESLFIETIQPQPAKSYDPLYSLRDYDHKGYVSAYLIYMSSVDERDAAMKLVGSMSHWRKLCTLKWFMNGRPECQFEGINQWREDMAARDASTAKKVILDQCKEQNVTAARALDKMSRDATPKAPKAKAVKSEADSNITNFLSRHEKSKDV